ncbi:MAG: hypothetical protein FJW35_16955, partial [Acidobacteria bacterium]|nr:hypothetical protein [Acidobacteriota bacterium]
MARKKKRGKGSRRSQEAAGQEAALQLTRAVSSGRLDDAVGILSRSAPDQFEASERKPVARALFLRALRAYSEGKHLNAVISDLALATRCYPADPRPWFHLGLTYFRAGIHAKAMWALRKAVELEPGNHRYLYHLAWAAVATGSQEAAQLLSRLGEETPESRFLSLASALLRPGSSDATISEGNTPATAGVREAEIMFLRALISAGGRLGDGPAPERAATDCELETPDLLRAESNLREAARLDPEN